MLVALSIYSLGSPSASAQASDDAGDEEWTVWYTDLFDREMPPSMEVSGRGLVAGLSELWARHMFETVRPNGLQGFSSFDLRWRHGRVDIRGDEEGARRLRTWLFGSAETTNGGYKETADRVLLDALARAHARLIERGETAEAILTNARIAADRPDFIRRLEEQTGS